MRIFFVIFLLISTMAKAAIPTPVNEQITDSVTATNVGNLNSQPINITNNNPSQLITGSNVKVLGDAPGMAMGNLYQTISSSIEIAGQN